VIVALKTFFLSMSECARAPVQMLAACLTPLCLIAVCRNVFTVQKGIDCLPKIATSIADFVARIFGWLTGKRVYRSEEARRATYIRAISRFLPTQISTITTNPNTVLFMPGGRELILSTHQMANEVADYFAAFPDAASRDRSTSMLLQRISTGDTAFQNAVRSATETESYTAKYEPFCLLLSGDPAVGKSSCFNQLNEYMITTLKDMAGSLYGEHFDVPEPYKMYTHSPGLSYPTGFSPRHWAYCVDDLNMLTDNRQFDCLLNGIMTSVPTMYEQASLADKGQRINVRSVFVATNDRSFTGCPVLAQGPDALARRFHMSVVVSVNTARCGELRQSQELSGRSDRAIFLANLNDPYIRNFHCYNVSDNNITHSPYNYVGGDVDGALWTTCNIHTFMSRYCEMWLQHHMDRYGSFEEGIHTILKNERRGQYSGQVVFPPVYIPHDPMRTGLRVNPNIYILHSSLRAMNSQPAPE
jgi:hypothetical protein